MGAAHRPRRALGYPLTCLADVSAFVTQGANGVCGPPTLSVAAALLFVLGVLGIAALWARRARSAILLCVLFALPGWSVIARRHVDEEPVTRLRSSVERFAVQHEGCVVLEDHGCEACDPIARRGRTPSRTCARPAVVELLSLEGPCVEHGDHLTCGSR